MNKHVEIAASKVTKIRAFIGFFVPDDVKDVMVGLQAKLGRLPMSCKMVERENIHVCLSFLGEVSDERVEEIKTSLSEISKGRGPFGLKVGGIKAIPNESYIRVIVLDVLDPSGKLKDVSSEVKELIGGDMKPPHLTLCRVRTVIDKKIVLSGLNALQKESVDAEFIVNSIALIKSVIGPSGPVYTVAQDSEFSK